MNDQIERATFGTLLVILPHAILDVDAETALAAESHLAARKAHRLIELGAKKLFGD